MVPERHPKSARRAFLAGAACGVAGAGLAGWAAWKYQGVGLWPAARDPIGPTADNMAMPGKYPGTVVEVHHPRSVLPEKTEGYARRDPEAVAAMIARGMQELVGSEDAVQAWRSMFGLGDRVGIKVVPVGKPDSISSHEVVRAVIDGLASAKVRLNDILVFERYKNEFMQCNYHRNLPDGVHWECSSAAYDDLQTEIDGQLPKKDRESRVAGYDRDVYRELAYCQPTHDPKDDRRFRSHLSNIVTQKVDKFISIPVLKDHRSGGITMCLKNLSHGLSNNVARSHITYAYRMKDGKRLEGANLNQCGTFIPSLASLAPTREKGVLQILDGLVGTYEGGPGNWNKTFATWNYQSLFFATDPVAMDQVGWEIIDAKRAEMGLPRISTMGVDTGVVDASGKPYPESFHHRQPQHVPLAATLGLGIFDPTREKIKHTKVELG